MKLTQIAIRLHQVASMIDEVGREMDIDFPDEMAPKMVMNAFVDDKLLEGLARNLRKDRD